MPLLEAASRDNELARVITVLAAGSEGDVRVDDLDLKHNFTLHACLAHCVVMTDFAIEDSSGEQCGQYSESIDSGYSCYEKIDIAFGQLFCMGECLDFP